MNCFTYAGPVFQKYPISTPMKTVSIKTLVRKTLWRDLRWLATPIVLIFSLFHLYDILCRGFKCTANNWAQCNYCSKWCRPGPCRKRFWRLCLTAPGRHARGHCVRNFHLRTSQVSVLYRAQCPRTLLYHAQRFKRRGHLKLVQGFCVYKAVMFNSQIWTSQVSSEILGAQDMVSVAFVSLHLS